MLKYKLDSLEGLDENLHSLYVKAEDGKFYLAVEGVVSKDKLDEFRNNNIELKKALEKYKDVDPAKYNELMSIQRQLDEKKLIEAGKIDEVVEQRVKNLRDDLNGKLENTSRELQSAQKRLEVLIIDNAVREAATKAGVLPTAVDDVLLRAKTVFSLEDGVAVPKDRDGKVIFGRDGQNPMGISDWIGSLKEAAPHLYQPSAGGGASGSGGARGGSNANLTATQKIEQGLGK